MIEVDGSQGEGGRQVLRSALSLSVITKKAIHVKNIRANRSSPGLKSQHLKAVDAAAAIGGHPTGLRAALREGRKTFKGHSIERYKEEL